MIVVQVWEISDGLFARTELLEMATLQPRDDGVYDVRLLVRPKGGWLTADGQPAAFSPGLAVPRNGLTAGNRLVVEGHDLRLGVWDLLGGALRLLLRDRLLFYQRWQSWRRKEVVG